MCIVCKAVEDKLIAVKPVGEVAGDAIEFRIVDGENSATPGVVTTFRVAPGGIVVERQGSSMTIPAGPLQVFAHLMDTAGERIREMAVDAITGSVTDQQKLYGELANALLQSVHPN